MTLLKGPALLKRAQELGVDTTGEPSARSTDGAAPQASDHELQRRVLEAERSIRESRLWLLTIIAALASVVSAVAAWVAAAK
jgi:hypothetical protein